MICRECGAKTVRGGGICAECLAQISDWAAGKGCYEGDKSVKTQTTTECKNTSSKTPRGRKIACVITVIAALIVIIVVAGGIWMVLV